MEPQDGSMPSESAEAEQEESRVAALEQRVAELEDLWRRALAELDNYRKRTARELARARRDERAKAAAEWLPVIDNLDLALEHARADPENIVEGVRAVRQQALAASARSTAPPPASGASGAAAGADDDDVIDADFTTG